MKYINRPKEFFLENSKFISILGVLVLAIVVPVTLSLVQQNQDNRQRAAEPEVSIIQSDPGAGGSGSGGTKTCGEVDGTCLLEELWNQSPDLCFGANVNKEYKCESNNQVCCIAKDPPSTTTPVPSRAPCSDQSGSYSCGFSTSDTQCPVCSFDPFCKTGNYSIAECSGTATCTVDDDCSSRPISCPAGMSGSVYCNTVKKQCESNCTPGASGGGNSGI